MIVECKPHNQVNVMMDGSRRVSLRNRQFVRKLDVPMPVSGVKPSQFYEAQYGESDVQHHPGEDAGVIEHGECEGSPGDTNEDNPGIVVDDQVTCQDRVAVGDGEGCVADGVVDQSPVKRSQRVRPK